MVLMRMMILLKSHDDAETTSSDQTHIFVVFSTSLPG